MKRHISLAILFSLILFFTLNSCEKDPEIITETVVVVETDTVILTVQDTILIHKTDTVTLTDFVKDTVTTFLLARHAETTGMGSNPSLSVQGLERVDELKRIMQNVSLNGVFSTNLNRTKETAQPVADEKGLALDIYNAFNPNQLADNVLEDFQSGVTLVIGHSNTIPELLNVLTGTSNFSTIPEEEYDNLFVVSVLEKGRANVVHMKYGQ